MGGSVSQVFRSGSALLLSNHNGKVSETSIDKIQTIFEILRANPKISMQTLEGLLCQIAKVSIFEITLNQRSRFFFNFHLPLIFYLPVFGLNDINLQKCSLLTLPV